MTNKHPVPTARNRAVCSILLACLFIICETAATIQAKAQSTGATVEPIVFVPPVIGAPGNRVGAGTRSGNLSSPGVSIVAPKGGGLTRLESPRLYWWLDHPFSGAIQIQLRANDAERPLLDLEENLSVPRGLQAFDLGSLGLRIRDRQIYEWSITLHPAGSGEPSRAITFLERRPSNAPVRSGDKATVARSLASEGIWFDAFAKTARDPGLLDYRNALLLQIGIK